MPPDETPLIEASFIISGEGFDPHTCAAIFGLEPTEVTVRGEPRPGNRPKAPGTSWSIDVRHRAYSIDEVIAEVLDAVWPQRETIKEFTQSATLRITFNSNVKIFADRPLYCLSPATVEKIAYFQAEFCLDIFDLSE